MASASTEALEQAVASDSNEQVSETEQEAAEPAEEPADEEGAAGAATSGGAGGSGGMDVQPGSRPASRASEASDETGSETDFTALHHKALAAKAGRPAGEGAAAAPALTEAALAASPWVDLEHPVTVYEGCKLVLMAPVVLLKLLVLAVAVPYAWAVLALLLLGHKPQTAMSPFRAFLVQQWIHQWGRFLLFVAGFYWIPVRGWANMRAAEAERAVLVFNHPSYVDAAVMATFFTPSGISKAGVASIPFIGLFAVALQLFFVERRGSSDRSNKHVLRGDAVQAIAERAVDRRFPLLAIAPEATTKAQPCLLKFRRGAFSAGQPVCPVLLRYRYRHFNPGWGIGFTPFHVYRLMAQFVNHLEIEVMPPYHPSEGERADWALYAENVRRLMGKRLGQPLVEQGISGERQLWRAGATVNWRGTRVLLPRRKPKAD